jgi:hypothetical protein
MLMALVVLACPCLVPLDLEERRAREDKFTAAAAAHVEAMRKDATAESRKLAAAHAWAGEYDYYPGPSEDAPMLVVAPGAGFVLESYGCGGLDDRNLGAVTEDGDTLQLHPVYVESQPRESETPMEYVRVSWGARRYLVPPAELEDFCNAVNVGTEPYALQRRGGGDTSGRPRTPAGPLECVLERPLWTRITAVHPSVATATAVQGYESVNTTVGLAAGRRQGLREGMWLFLQATAEFADWQLTVSAVDDDSSRATFTRVGRKEDRARLPSVGWPVTSRQQFSVR